MKKDIIKVEKFEDKFEVLFKELDNSSSSSYSSSSSSSSSVCDLLCEQGRPCTEKCKRWNCSNCIDDSTKPIYKSSQVKDNARKEIEITFNKYIANNSAIDKSDFIVKVDSVNKTIGKVEIKGGKVIITINEDISNGKKVYVKYTKNSEKTKHITDANNNAVNSLARKVFLIKHIGK